ncbi:molecular chaperone, partial [Salmonella enterica]|nr:molecular chaperone [Salmonella enterica]
MLTSKKSLLIFILVFTIKTASAASTFLAPKLDRSRIIYPEESTGGVSLQIKNKNKFPVLVQAKVINEEGNKNVDFFIVTPPIFRLNQDEQTRIRVILTNKSEIPKDREKMFWLCVKAIPPESKVNLLTRVEMVPNECIKLFARPSSLSGLLTSDVPKIRWVHYKNTVIAKNNTPYYIVFNKLIIGGGELNMPGYLPPYGEQRYKVNNTKYNHIKYNIIDDNGGISDMY